MKKNLFRRIVSSFIGCIFIAGTMGGCQTQEAEIPTQSQQPNIQSNEDSALKTENAVSLDDSQANSQLEETPTREYVSSQIEVFKTKLSLNPKDDNIRLLYARNPYQANEEKKIKN